MNQVVDGAITVCFDVMENLCLPKSPIGQTYYSRQLYLYVFGVVVHHGERSSQTPNDVHLYVWQEHQNRKDSNMIASALHHCFTVCLRGRLRNATQLRLFSDSCYGQNKNMNVLSMLFALRKAYFPHLAINFTFPIRGHSFLPADRVFGRIEQDLRRKDTILLPSDYHAVLRSHGTLLIYGDDWKAQDFKAATSRLTKTTRSFKISEARVLEIRGNELGFKSSYHGEFCNHPILKRGKKWDQFKPSELPMISTVKAAKKTDVLSLLDGVGASEEVRAYYVDALAAPTAAGNAGSDSEDE